MDHHTATPRQGPRRHMRPTRVVRHALVAAALLLVATGCIRTEVSIEVNEDGSGVMGFLLAFDRQLMSALEAFGDDEAGFDTDMLLEDIDVDDLPLGATVEPYEEGDFTGVVFRVPFEDGDDIAATLARIASDAGDGAPLDSDEGPFDEFELARHGDEWRFAALVDPASDETFDEFAEDEGSLDFARALFGDAMFTVRLKLPGEVTEHNADSIETDGTLRWEIDLFSDEARELHATADAGSTGGFLGVLGADNVGDGWLMIGVLVVVGALIALAGWFAVRQTRAADE